MLNEEAERLGAALEALDPDHREVIVLRKLEELSFKEVAARMGRSEDACRMLLARAMVALTLAAEGHAMSDGAEALFARWVEHHVAPTARRSIPAALCADRPDLLPELKALIARYLDVSGLARRPARPASRRGRARAAPRRSRSSRGSARSSASAPAAWGRSTSSTT